ncbi:MAG: hypothetical protein OHK0048_09390 [Rhodoferax sp.]
MSEAVRALLAQIDSEIASISEAIIRAEPETLSASSARLRGLMLQLAQQPRQVATAYRQDPALRAQVRKMAGQLSAQREALARHATRVDQAIHTLIPMPASATYDGAGSVSGLRKYGSPGQRSGEFQPLVA